MFAISDEVKYKYNISNNSYYFILPQSIKEDSATESDLILVRMKEFVGIDPGTDFYPNGITIIGEKIVYNKNGEPTPKSLTGKIIYESINGTNAVKTVDGVKLRHSFTSPAGYVEYEFLPFDQLKSKFILKYIFSVSKQIKLSINACGDVFFDSFEDAEKYTRFLTFYGGELNQADMIVVVNEKCIHFNHYDVFFNNELYNIDHQRLFEYLCSISGNSDQASYLRSFPLRAEWFEIVAMD